MLRTVLAAGLAALLAASAAHAHVHVDVEDGPGAGAPCAVCQLRGAEPVDRETPDVVPVILAAADVALPRRLPPVTGAPQGAIPGQSPPPVA